MITSTMLGPFNAIGGNRFSGEGGDPFGLGHSVFFYTKFMFPHSYVKMIGVNGGEPTSETIAAKKYLLTAEVFVAVRQDMPARSSALLFRDWLFTDDGQNAIIESGYVPIE